MCGICGVFNLDGKPADLSPVHRMRDQLAHRGPDDSGDWKEGPAGLGFRRLSILDLEGGHQPMASPDGKLGIVFNGEIYNHPRLKTELESQGVRFRTRSDTETILHMYDLFGAEAFDRLNGMFAVGLWDGRKRQLFLARDPLGVKPLYYSIEGQKLYFSSELRPLIAAGISDAVDPGAVCEYLINGFVNSPRTILSRVMKLPPGHYLRIDAEGMKIQKYWEAAESAPLNISFEEAREELERRLCESVKGQLLSDVPVGAFLSGGVDSSLVTALMTQASGRKISTFSIGFSGTRSGLDESAHARKVSRHLGTDHHELVLPAEVLDRMEDLVPSMDEPIADSAILPTFLLSQFARKEVKVVLTGEGADELFAGYNRYKAAYLSERLASMPAWARHFAAPMARHAGKGKLFENIPIRSLEDWASAHSNLGALTAVCRPDFLESSRGQLGKSWALNGGGGGRLNSVLRYDLRTILADCLLMKVDKAAMRASLEARVPFLDKELVNFALALPSGFKIRRLKGKYILRRVAEKYLPSAIVWRRKHGFIVPWEEWIRRPASRRIDEVLAQPSSIFDSTALAAARKALSANQPAVDAGLFFRVVIFNLWQDSLKKTV